MFNFCGNNFKFMICNFTIEFLIGGKKKFFQKFNKPLRKSGRKVNLDHKRKNKIEFVEPQFKPAAAPPAPAEHPSESEFSGINREMETD